MKSEFEQSAQAAAVAAAERRWRERRDAERSQLRMKNAKGCLALVLLLTGLVAGGWLVVRSPEVNVPGCEGVLDVARILAGVEKESSAFERRLRDDYADNLQGFCVERLVLWKDAPPAVKPKTSQRPLRFLALVEAARDDVQLYDLQTDGRGRTSVKSLSPLSCSSEVPYETFKDAVSGKVYFVRCEGAVYVCGSEDLAQARAALSRLTAVVSERTR